MSARSSTGTQDSLSIDATNALRASMGLAPLAQQTQEDIAAERAQHREAEAEARRQADEAETAAFRAELAARKQKRAEAAKLESVPSLGAALASVSGGSAADWVNRSRQIGMSEAAKAQALKQAQLKKEQAKADYSSSELRGLKVKHSSDQFGEGESVILTLKDTTILKGGFGADDVNDEEDVLENVQLSEAEKMARAQDSKKRAKQAAYDVYGDANVLLEQYEDEQEKARREEEANSMRIGEGMVSEKKRRAALLGQADFSDEPDGMGPKKTLYSLDFEKKLASDYKEPKFKKRVKKEKDGSGKKVRKALVDEELYSILAEPDAEQRALDLGSRASRSAQDANEAAKQALKDQSYLKAMKKAEEKTKKLLVEAKAAFEDDDEEVALRQSIERARRLKESKAQSAASSVERLAAEVRAKKEQTAVKTEEDTDMDVDGVRVKQEKKDEDDGAIVFTSTSEFCRGLEDVREDEEEEQRRQRAKQRQKEREAEEREREKEDKASDDKSGWVKAESKVKEEEPRVKIEDEDLNEDRDDDDEHEDVSMSVKKEEGDEGDEGADEDEVAFLSDEPALDGGIGAALKMAKLRGFLHQESEQIGRAQDKEFRLRPEEDPAPNIKLEYLDEFGRELKPKEAFRLLSHKFHGKGPSARKAEKKLKLLQEAKKRRDAAAKDMANTGLVAKLKKKQHQTGQAFVVLDDKLTPTSLNTVSRNAEESSAREGQAQRRGKAAPPGSASTLPGAKTPSAPSRKRKHE